MGKNKKKNTSLPKHCVQPKNTSGPQLLERIDPQVICPYCVHGFALSRAKFTDARPICPHCNETILTQDYDCRYKEIKTECPPVIEKADRVLKHRDKLAVARVITPAPGSRSAPNRSSGRLRVRSKVIACDRSIPMRVNTRCTRRTRMTRRRVVSGRNGLCSPTSSTFFARAIILKAHGCAPIFI